MNKIGGVLARRFMFAALVAVVASAYVPEATVAQPKGTLFTAGTVRAAAVLNLIAAAQERYKEENTVYADDLQALTARKLLPEAVKGGVWFGYRYDMSADEGSFSVIARPVSDKAGTLRFLRRSNEEAVRVNATDFRTDHEGVSCTVHNRDPNEKDRTIRAFALALPSTATWSDTRINVADGDAVLIAGDGQIKVGPSWRPNGPDGSDEKSSWGDFRSVKDGKVGCLTARIEGDEGAYTVGAFAFFVSGKAGSLHLGVNDTDAANNTGGFDTWVVVIRP